MNMYKQKDIAFSKMQVNNNWPILYLMMLLPHTHILVSATEVSY